MRHILFTFALALPLLAQEQPATPTPNAQPAPAAATPVLEKKLSILKVNATNQGWAFVQPWTKRPPFGRKGIGAVLPGARVLVTADLVSNATFVEFEMPEGGAKSTASVEFVDYEANLALLKPSDEKFLAPFSPLELTTAKVGDTVSALQLEASGLQLSTRGPVTTIEVERYSLEDYVFLTYSANLQLPQKDYSFCMPALKDGKLVGVLMRYESSSNQADIIPTPVIEHFLKDLTDGKYAGFPRPGLAFAPTRDPQFRKYLGLGDEKGGVYITDTLKDSPAEKAGIAKGDVLLSIGGESVDSDGNYEHPEYGKISFSHLTTRYQVGEKIAAVVQRKGEKKQLEITAAHREPTDFVSDPYIIDKPPRYYVLGGCVLQELSRQYLREFSNSQAARGGPPELAHLDRYQSELLRDGPKKVVFLSRVLPSPLTIGYEDLRFLRVLKINDVALDTLNDVPAALEKAANGFHKIEFDEEPRFIYLDAAAVKAAEPNFLRSYRIPSISRLD